MLCVRIESNNKYFFISHLRDSSSVQWFQFCIEKKSTRNQPETENEKKQKKRFVKYCAHKRLLDKILTKHELENAYKGVLPERLNIHHYIPKFAGGTDDFGNLCIIDKNLHEFLHMQIWDIVEQNCTLGQIYHIALPRNKRVLTCDDFCLFFSQPEMEKINQTIAAKERKAAYRIKKAKHRQNKYRNGGRQRY